MLAGGVGLYKMDQGDANKFGVASEFADYIDCAEKASFALESGLPGNATENLALEDELFKLCRAKQSRVLFPVVFTAVIGFISLLAAIVSTCCRPSTGEGVNAGPLYAYGVFAGVSLGLLVFVIGWFLLFNLQFWYSWSECDSFPAAFWTSVGGSCGDEHNDVVGAWQVAFQVFFTGAVISVIAQLSAITLSSWVVQSQAPYALRAAEQ
jgi:hypothetical protein